MSDTQSELENSKQPLSVSDLASILTIWGLSIPASYILLLKLFSKSLIIEINGTSHEKILSDNTFAVTVLIFILACGFSCITISIIELWKLHATCVSQNLSSFLRKADAVEGIKKRFLFLCLPMILVSFIVYYFVQAFPVVLVLMLFIVLTVRKSTPEAAYCGYQVIWTLLLCFAIGIYIKPKPTVLIPEKVSFSFPTTQVIPKKIYQLDSAGKLIQTKSNKWILTTALTFITLKEKAN